MLYYFKKAILLLTVRAHIHQSVALSKMSGPWPGYRGPQLFILLLATMYTVLYVSASMQYQELDQDNRPWHWTDCSKLWNIMIVSNKRSHFVTVTTAPPGDHRIIGNFRVQPVPLKLGQKWSANLSFTLSEQLYCMLYLV